MSRAVPLLLLLLPCCAPEAPAPVERSAVAAPEQPSGPTVVFLGDSLTAGYGLSQSEAFPSLVHDALAAEGLPFRLVDAGVSGDTTAGGVGRIDWLLRQEPDVVVLELGANDGLRGRSLEEMESNLRALVARSREAGARVLLCGMRLPPNYGSEYADGFAEVFPRLAQELELAFVPFLLEGVAGVTELNLDDGLHPNAVGQRKVAENLKPHLAELLR